MRVEVVPEDWGSLYGPFIKDWFRAGVLLPFCSVLDMALALTTACLILTGQSATKGPTGWAIVALAAVLGSAALSMSVLGVLDPKRERFRRWMHAVEPADEACANAEEALKRVSIAAMLARRPELYVIDSESVNAYLVGQPPAQAHILVTKELLERMDEAEQEAVFAHLIARFVKGTPPVSEFGFSEADVEALRLLENPVALLGAIQKTAGCGSRIEWDEHRLYRLMAVPFDDEDVMVGGRNRALRAHRLKRLREVVDAASMN